MGQRLAGRVAVVTGAGRGIGRGIALLLASEGAAVVVNDLGGNVDGSGASSEPAGEVVEEIRRRGGRAVANRDSVASFEAAGRIIQTAVKEFGRLDILVNNAGILRDRMIFNLSEEDFDLVVSVHLNGTFFCTRHAAPIMRQQKTGRIISMSSTSGLFGNAGQANYGAAKDGIAGFTRVVSRDLGKYGVTVNAIAPGASTRMIATIPRRPRQERAGETEPLPEPPSLLTDPEDVAPFVAYLASDAASNINGQTFMVMGGVVSLLNYPAPARTMTTRGRWTAENIATIFPRTIGMELHNPAPEQEPK